MSGDRGIATVALHTVSLTPVHDHIGQQIAVRTQKLCLTQEPADQSAFQLTPKAFESEERLTEDGNKKKLDHQRGID